MPVTNRPTLNNIITLIDNKRKLGNRRVSRCCSVCQTFGHDRRTCSVLLDNMIQQFQSESEQSETGINYEIIKHIETSILTRYATRHPNPTPPRPSVPSVPSVPSAPSAGIALKMIESFDEGTYIDNNCNVCLDDVNKHSMIMFQCGHGCCDNCACQILSTTHKCHMCRDNVSELRICKDIPIDTFNKLNTILKF